MDYQFRYVLFVDFLGFSAAIKRATHETWPEIADFIVWATERANAMSVPAGGEYTDNGAITVTCFSDNIVIRFAPPNFQHDWQEMFVAPLYRAFYFRYCKAFVAHVAAKALKLNLLVRGGLAFGPLFHDKRGIVGKALIDAYLLESKVACYPRVVLSPKICTRQNDELSRDSFVQDADGIWHLDYFSPMAKEAVSMGLASNAAEWTAVAGQIAKTNMGLLEKEDRVADCAKWVWFHSHLVNADTVPLPDALTVPTEC